MEHENIKILIEENKKEIVALKFSKNNVKEMLTPEEAIVIKIKKISKDMYIDIQMKKNVRIYAEYLNFKAVFPQYYIPLDKYIENPITTTYKGKKVYINTISLKLPLSYIKEYSNGLKEVKIKISYQGCVVSSICYRPMEKTFKIDL